MRLEMDEKNVARHLVARGVIPDGTPMTVRELGGGVSSTVLSVQAGSERYVVKQPLPRFRVADDWEVDTRRVAVEAHVARLLSERIGAVAVRDYDPANGILVMDAVPAGFRPWKERLFAGELRGETAVAVGVLLTKVHALGARLAPDALREDELFRQQRIAPYFETAASREPEAAEALATLAERFFTRSDLVHGDYSPKNLFADPSGRSVRLIDHEVTTRGDAAFDVGFLLSHLVLKAVHMPQRAAGFHELGAAFVHAYRDTAGIDPAMEARGLEYTGGLLLARAVGKSRAEYLDASGRAAVTKLALVWLADPPPTWRDVRERLPGLR